MIRLFKKLCKGAVECPCCRQLDCYFRQVILVFSDEPPMLGYWECEYCYRKTDIFPTSLTEDAVRNLGYNDFNEYLDELLK